MVKCCIAGCRSSSKHALVVGVRLHRFPTKNMQLRRTWMRFALYSGTLLSRLDMLDHNTNTTNVRICSEHFIDRNRYINPEPALLPDGRLLVSPPPGSVEANYLKTMDLEEREDAGADVAEVAYKFDIGPYDSLEAFIDAKLMELDFSSMMDTATEHLEMKLKQTERKTREVNQIFAHCESQLKLLMSDAMDKGGAMPIETDSDDDVMIVQTGFDPERAARSQQQMRAQQRGPMPMGMQQRFQLKNGTLISRPQAPYQGGPRGPAPIEGSMQMQQRRPLTTMYAPPTKLADLVVGMRLYGKKVTDIWYRGTLTEIHNKEKPRTEWRYRIKFEGKGMKVLPGREIAFVECPTDTLPVGSRVVAKYKDEDNPTANAHYAGIVSESPSLRNNQRYLIFFDDGYAQYCYSSEIHKVYEQSRNVWEDVHRDSQEFIKSYLKQYPERPMVRLQSNQIIKTEWNGRWWTARVLETDGSLVKMFFDADKRIEWIYRGSTRLEPLYTELANAEMSKAGKGHRRHNIGMKGSKKPVVEYLRGTDEDFMKRKQPDAQYKKLQDPHVLQRSTSTDSMPEFKKRSVARKSTSKIHQETSEERRPQFQASSLSRNAVAGHDHATHISDGEAMGERMKIDRGRDLLHKRFVQHRCDGDCLDGTELDPTKFRGHNPLIIPMLSGWERQISRQKNSARRCVFYRAPCARRMRCLDEVEYYLRETDSQLTIDLFCYDHLLHTHSEFVPIKTFCDIKDLSYGKETVRISCVNGIDRQYPDYVEYSNQRIPASGVYLNLDSDFLIGCDHAGPCGDPDTCSCAELTLEASNTIPGPKPEVLGYQHRRLREPINTGLYECNQRCKCDHRCGNRVAQNGLQLRLQVFKTEKRGWGLRCLDDIPAGGFICVYAGQLLTEQGANEDGQQYGDEYLAELDYIEVVERCKEGYESDVDINADEGIEQDVPELSDTSEEAEFNAPSDSDSTFSGGKAGKAANQGGPNRQSSRRRTKKTLPGEEEGVEEKRTTKIVIKRGADEEKTWSVKMKSPQSKTKEWVDSIPDLPAPVSIIISDEDDDMAGKGAEGEKTKGNDEAAKKPGTGAEAAAAKKDVDEDEGMEDCEPQLDGENKLGKMQKPATNKVIMKLKSKLFGSGEINMDTDTVDMSRKPLRIPRIRGRGIGSTSTDHDKNEDKKQNKCGLDAKVAAENKASSLGKENLVTEENGKKAVSKKKSVNKEKKKKEPPPQPPEEEENEHGFKTRLLYNNEPFCYVMDAKSNGNIGRYLNHSCGPNVFVQNVFVDTHDMRFPWVAFFAGQFIRSGTELTWDYNYEVGSVPGKVLYCYCGAAECRGRLL